MEIWGVKVDTRALKDLSDGFGADLRRLEKMIYELAGQEFNINSPQQLSSILFTQAEPSGHEENEGQPELLDLDRHPPGAGPAPSARPVRPGIQAGGEAQVHLRRRPAAPHRPRDRPDPHLLQPDGRLHGTAILERSQSPEHPGPGRARQALPAGLHPGRGGRLSSRPTTRRSSCGSWPTSPAIRPWSRPSSRTGTSTKKPRPGSSARTRTSSRTR